jgi:hypothetical protein
MSDSDSETDFASLLRATRASIENRTTEDERQDEDHSEQHGGQDGLSSGSPAGPSSSVNPSTSSRGLNTDGGVRELANQLKRRKKIQPASEAELDTFIEVSNVHPCHLSFHTDELAVFLALLVPT